MLPYVNGREHPLPAPPLTLPSLIRRVSLAVCIAMGIILLSELGAIASPLAGWAGAVIGVGAGYRLGARCSDLLLAALARLTACSPEPAPTVVSPCRAERRRALG